jgi:pimeloyl-ACP methyl ester carboxylesterase
MQHGRVFETWARLQETGTELGNRFAMSLGVSPAFLTGLGQEAIGAFIDQAPAAHTIRRIKLGQRIDIQESARQIQAPTLIIRGTQDYLIPEYQTRELHNLIPGSWYEALECVPRVPTVRPPGHQHETTHERGISGRSGGGHHRTQGISQEVYRTLCRIRRDCGDLLDE